MKGAHERRWIYKRRFDEKTSAWKDEELLQPGKLVWLEMRGIDMPADKVMTTQKLRPRNMGPVKIKRGRRSADRLVPDLV